MLSLDIKTVADVSKEIALRIKQRRLEKNFTQEGIAIRSGVKLPTLRRFEKTGEISFQGLIKIAFALDILEDFDQLFTQRQYETLEDVLSECECKRKRGKRK